MDDNMKTHKEKQEIVVGSTTFTLTRDEVEKALFAFVFGKDPTQDEKRRMHFCVHEGRQRDTPWRIDFILKDNPV